MGGITTQRARKNWRCSRCGREIRIGDTYYALKYNYHPVVRRCMRCKFESWENTSSNYVWSIGRLQKRIGNTAEIDEDSLQSLIEELEDMCSDVEDSLDNLPDNLSDSSLGMKLQDRIDDLQSAVESLEQIEEIDINEVRNIVNSIQLR